MIEPGSMIDPEQEAFRQQLRARLRPPADPDDDWTPRRRWEGDKRTPGPPANPNPSPRVQSTQRWRQKQKLAKLQEQLTAGSVPSPNKPPL